MKKFSDKKTVTLLMFIFLYIKKKKKIENININNSSTNNEMKIDGFLIFTPAKLHNFFLANLIRNSYVPSTASYHLNPISKASNASKRWEIPSLLLYSCSNLLFEAQITLASWPIEEVSSSRNHSIISASSRSSNPSIVFSAETESFFDIYCDIILRFYLCAVLNVAHYVYLSYFQCHAFNARPSICHRIITNH